MPVVNSDNSSGKIPQSRSYRSTLSFPVIQIEEIYSLHSCNWVSCNKIPAGRVNIFTTGILVTSIQKGHG